MNNDLRDFIRRQRAGLEQSGLPLKDIRVIDMGTVVAAPFTATFLADFGAEVIKVENPDIPDATRAWGVTGDGLQPWWLVVNRNKLPVTLNLRTTEGKEILAGLIGKSDILVENFRKGVLDRLGFSASRLFELNKGLIIGRISGYGQTGPYSSRPGFGTLAEGFSGFTYLNRQPDNPPVSPPLPLADMIAGLHLAFAIMVALRTARRGEYGGREIDVSLYEPLLGMLGGSFLEYWLSGEIPQPTGSEMSYTAPRNNYQTKDGKWLALSASAQVPFERLMDAIGKPEYKTDPRFKTNEARTKKENREELNRVISTWFSGMTAREALTACEEREITAGPIMNMHDIAGDQHVGERRTLVDLTDPVTGKVLRVPDVAMRISGSPGQIRFPGLPPGTANEVIYGDLLGYSAGQLADFKAKKVF
ncbi:MAG: CoA transferase [Dehalococcoidia bacterium]|nr:CoA transferase [Dehalococcoidia bacterium]